jgi:hypothetical protein
VLGLNRILAKTHCNAERFEKVRANHSARQQILQTQIVSKYFQKEKKYEQRAHDFKKKTNLRVIRNIVVYN